MTLLLICAVVLFQFCSSSKYQWRNLTYNEIHSWYNSIELCILNNTDRQKLPQDVRSKDCAMYSRGNRRVHCSVGMGSLQTPCYSPFGEARPSFLKCIDGYCDSDHKNLLKTILKLIETNTSLVFLGDSTMRQKLNAFSCELSREEPKAYVDGNLYGMVPCHSKIDVYLPNNQGMLDLHGISIGPSAYYCLPNGKGKSDPSIGIWENANDIIIKLNEMNRNTLIVANAGLWYNDEIEFENHVPYLLNWLHNLATFKNKRNTVVWHETMSQHWLNDYGSGYFYKPYADKQEYDWFNGTGQLKDKIDNIKDIPLSSFQVPSCCTAITNSSYMADWRNDIVKNYFKKLDLLNKGLKYWDFVEITRDVPDMHICNQYYNHDCTHYCYWPLLWQVFWYQLEEITKYL